MDDEAFYWAYSHFPAFGYFEHPPLIALFTGAGYWLFKSELGHQIYFAACQIINGAHYSDPLCLHILSEAGLQTL